MFVAHIASAFTPYTYENERLLLAALMTVIVHFSESSLKIKEKRLISGWEDILASCNIIEVICAGCFVIDCYHFTSKVQTEYEQIDADCTLKKDNIFLLCFENRHNLSLPRVEKKPKI